MQFAPLYSFMLAILDIVITILELIFQVVKLRALSFVSAHMKMFLMIRMANVIVIAIKAVNVILYFASFFIFDNFYL